MTDDTTLPTPTDTGRGRVSTLEQLAEIPEEDIWLQKQKRARTRRAYRLDVQHFMRTLAITTPAELRQADHKAVIAWEPFMRETDRGPRQKWNPIARTVAKARRVTGIQAEERQQSEQQKIQQARKAM